MPGLVGVVVKPGDRAAGEAAERVIRRLAERGVDFAVEEDSARVYEGLRGYPTFRLDRDPPGRVIVVGGDGTLLRTAMKLADPGRVLLMAVRAGKRGFLLDVEPHEVEERVDDFLEGRFRVVEYPRLQPSTPDAGEALPCALNDVAFVAQKARLASLTVYADGEKIYNIDGDGVVVATTVGSTAYSLSAGGPIIDPRLDAHVVTPLNPVQLFLRSVVLPPTVTIEVEVKPHSHPVYMSIDGQHLEEPKPGSLVRIERCSRGIRIARFHDHRGHYQRLLERLLQYW
ncbi:NAD(+)/NADH kinase [Stetteria hydrogenophila]